MTKKKNLKIKKDRRREERISTLFRKRHYKETVDYALDYFFKVICEI